MLVCLYSHVAAEPAVPPLPYEYSVQQIAVNIFIQEVIPRIRTPAGTKYGRRLA